MMPGNQIFISLTDLSKESQRRNINKLPIRSTITVLTSENQVPYPIDERSEVELLKHMGKKMINVCMFRSATNYNVRVEIKTLSFLISVQSAPATGDRLAPRHPRETFNS